MPAELRLLSRGMASNIKLALFVLAVPSSITSISNCSRLSEGPLLLSMLLSMASGDKPTSVDMGLGSVVPFLDNDAASTASSMRVARAVCADVMAAAGLFSRVFLGPSELSEISHGLERSTQNTEEAALVGSCVVEIAPDDESEDLLKKQRNSDGLGSVTSNMT